MASFFDSISDKLAAFIAEQKIYFVATAAQDGRVNLSPKGMDSLRVLDSNRVVWLNLTGSGNETAAHLAKVNRMTVMFCSFDKAPMILRLYGTARTLHPRDLDWGELHALFPDYPAARNIFDMTVESVQTSCGFAVPFMEYRGERPALVKYHEKQGPDGVAQYWAEKNQVSIDGFPTGLLVEQ